MAIGRSTNWRFVGPIALRGDIRTEFGGPVSTVRISRYRLGGSYVRDTGANTWAPMAARSDINGNVARFGTQSFSDYRGSSRYRETFGTVNGSNGGMDYVPFYHPEGGLRNHQGSWQRYYSFPRGFQSLGTGSTSTGTFPIITLARNLSWPNFFRSNLRSSSVSVSTQGDYVGIKNGYYVTQTRSAAIQVFMTKTRSTAYYTSNTSRQHGQRYRFRSGESWVSMWQIRAGAFSNDGTQVGGTLYPSGGTSSFRGSGGGGGKGGKGGTAAPGGFVVGGRTPSDQNAYFNMRSYYAAGYRYCQVMHSMEATMLRGTLARNRLNIGNASIRFTT